MSTKLHTGLAGLAITLGLIACTPDDPLTPKPATPRAPEPPQLAVVDGANGGADAFRWLPPFSAIADYFLSQATARRASPRRDVPR